MELRVRLRYKSTSDFGKGDHLNFDKSLAHALEWLYDEDQFEDERTWLYCMEGVLPIYIMMSIVTDIFTFALQDYAETNIKDYILRMEEGNDKHGWNDNKPSLLYLGDEIVLGRVHTFTSEVILWATYLYASFRADIEDDNEKLTKAKDVLYKLFWKKTGMKEEFVKDTFLMKHFDQTIRDFAMDVLHRYKDDKPVADNEPQQTPVNNKMEKSVLNYISANEIRCYYEGWRNGKHGAICQWDGIYRFVEQERGKSGILDDVKKNKDDNPIVAIGIVAYWLQFNSRMDTVIKRLTKYNCEIPKNIREQFENYTQIRFEQFRREHRDDPNTLDWDWEREFYANIIIPHEMAFNKLSEALFDYISDSDIELVRGVMNSYIKYLKKIRTEKGYQVNPELLVLRAIESGDETKYEDLEEFEINTILDKLENKGYIQVAWIEGHQPEGVRLLDKGRCYLKYLEEGSVAEGTNPSVTPQQPPKEDTAIIPSQTPQMPQISNVSDEETNEENEWDDSYDNVFKDEVNPQLVFNKLEKMTYPRVTDNYPRIFVFFKVLLYLSWIENHQKNFLKWANCHWKFNWKHDHNFKFGNNIQKELRDTDMSEWDENTCNGSDIGKAYRCLAKRVLDELADNVNDGKVVDRTAFYKEGVKSRINDGKKLVYPF